MPVDNGFWWLERRIDELEKKIEKLEKILNELQEVWLRCDGK